MSCGGDGQRARISAALDPAEVEEPGAQPGADGAGDMRAALAPVEAGAAERPLRSLADGKFHPKRPEKFGASRGYFAAIFGQHDVAVLGQRVGDPDAKPAGDVVVA